MSVPIIECTEYRYIQDRGMAYCQGRTRRMKSIFVRRAERSVEDIQTESALTSNDKNSMHGAGH